jgi:hypothetical protein
MPQRKKPKNKVFALDFLRAFASGLLQSTGFVYRTLPDSGFEGLDRALTLLHAG